MKMLRHYFVGDNLDELEVVEEELENAGVSTPQIHVLSEHEDEVGRHRHLHEVQSLMKKDVVHSTLIGGAIGAVGAALVLLVSYYAGWTETAAGWLPFVFLAVVVFGFCTWEGGLRGIQEPNHNFRRFQTLLHDGKHVLFVDLEPDQEPALERVLQGHPHLELAGTGAASPHWLINWQRMTGMFRQT